MREEKQFTCEDCHIEATKKMTLLQAKLHKRYMPDHKVTGKL